MEQKKIAKLCIDKNRNALEFLGFDKQVPLYQTVSGFAKNSIYLFFEKSILFVCTKVKKANGLIILSSQLEQVDGGLSCSISKFIYT